MGKILAQGAEATIELLDGKVHKVRYPKSYRHENIDSTLRKGRTKRELKALKKAAELGVSVPEVYESNDMYTIVMEELKGERLRDVAVDGHASSYFEQVGIMLASLHEAGLIHGDLTTSNILVSDKVYFIDFGLSYFSDKIEDMAVDIHVFEEALESTHHECASLYYESFLNGYVKNPQHHNILKRLDIVRARGRNKK